MPPKAAPRGGGGPRGAPRGSSSARGRGGPPAAQGRSQAGLPSPHITTIGVRRPAFGSAGRAIKVKTNFCEATVPSGMIWHYDVAITPEGGRKFNFNLIKKLQCEVAQDIFDPRCVYDGQKNMFSSHELALGPTRSREFDIVLDQPRAGKKPPRAWKVKITFAATINTELLSRFVNGGQSLDNTILTAITALNVVVRMQPNLLYPYNSRSFFTEAEKANLGLGLEVWRGYFQSVRPAIGRLLINIDISSALMYNAGALINLCLAHLGINNPNMLATIPEPKRHELQRFISGVKIRYGQSQRQHTIQGVGRRGANQETFTTSDGTQTDVAAYFRGLTNRPLQFPTLPCVKVSARAMIPIELCQVIKGQICRKEIPPEIQDRFRDFSTKKPHERLQSIQQGITTFQYTQSNYIAQFGMTINTATLPMTIDARQINPPQLEYGNGSKEKTITPRSGAWNMIDKKFIKPQAIGVWMIAVFERENRFSQADCQQAARDFVENCRAVGVTVNDPNPFVRYLNAQAGVSQQLRAAGGACAQAKKGPPMLILVVLPDGGNDIWRAVKFFGDVEIGVVTQCVKSGKARRAKAQYWANVLLKLNAKLGGINHVTTQSSVPLDPRTPTIIMGADVMHPAPGRQSEDYPSFAALVSSVDSRGSMYISRDSVQKGRQEIIEDLKNLVVNAINMFIGYRTSQEKLPPGTAKPARLIFYRDGVGENQFEQVMREEVSLIREACDEAKVNPKITFIIVGKRHHARFFPMNEREADRSGNCQAGTVVDSDITHPTDFDFYLQSHAGIIGTSRSAHYSVLFDQYNFTPDAIQALSFALCHVYARSTRSVSIPAPVYYADIVCARAKTRFDPEGPTNLSDTASTTSGGNGPSLDTFRQAFRPLHAAQSRRMYFM